MSLFYYHLLRKQYQMCDVFLASGNKTKVLNECVSQIYFSKLIIIFLLIFDVHDIRQVNKRTRTKRM